MARVLLPLIVSLIALDASSAGSTASQILQQKKPAGTAVVRGRVIAADTGVPIRDALVGVVPVGPQASLRVPRDAPPRGAVQVDADGRFELTGLAAGFVRLLATPGAASLRYLPTRFPDPLSAEPQPIRLAAGRTLDDIVSALPRAGVIAGRIVNERGEPLGMTGVAVYEVLPGDRRQLFQSPTGAGWRTDDTGSFRVFGLPPGSYYLLAQPVRLPIASGAVTSEYSPTFYPGTQSIAEATPIKVAHGDEHLEVELVVGGTGKTFSVRGTVVDADGDPASMVQLKVDRVVVPNTTAAAIPALPTLPLTSSTATTDAMGTFTLSGLPPGEANVSVHRYGARGAEFAWTPLTVTADVDGLVIRLQPGATIRGRITFDGGVPASHASLRVRAVSLRPIALVNSTSVQPNPDDTFTLEHQFGPILIRTEGLPGWHLESVQSDGRDITEVPTEFTTGTADVDVVVTRRAAALSGVARTAAGTPVEAAILVFSENPTLWHERATTTRMGEAGPDGRYTLDGIRPGRYLAVALPKEGTTLTGSTPAYFELLAKHATRVVIEAAAPKTIDLEVRPPRPH